MSKHYSVLAGLVVYCLMGIVVAAAGQAPAVFLDSNLTLGVEDGDEKLMFGRIVRIDVDSRGNIYVLDYKFRRVSVFDSKGNLLRQIAVPEGQGPREAANLSGIAVTPGGTLLSTT